MKSKWSNVSPYFHATVWTFNLTLFTVWLWELRTRNVTPKNIPAAFALMTMSLALALLNSCVFLLIGGTHELDIGGESTHQWMCAFCGTLAIFGQYLVRVSVWAFFVVRGSLVTSFHRRLNQIAGATPYVLSAHTCLFAALCVLFVDVEKGHHSHHSQMCHVHKFPLWLLFVGPMAGDLFYGIGFFVIFYKTLRSSYLKSIKALSMRERMATERQLRRNLALFVMQLMSAIGAYVLIVAMNFSFTSFELAEMNAAITNLCLFALFQGRTKVYTCCSRVLCPEHYHNLLRHDEVQCELRGGDTKKRRKTIDAFRQKEKDMEVRRKSFAIQIDDLKLENEPLREHMTVDSVTVETSDVTTASGRRFSVPILGDDRVFCNRWNAGESAVVKLPAVVMAHALGSVMDISPPPPRIRAPVQNTAVKVRAPMPHSKTGSIHSVKNTLQIPFPLSPKPSEMSKLSEASKSSTLAVPMGAFANVLESEHLRSVTISSKASKVLGVSEALVGLDFRHRKRMFRNLLTASQSADVTEIVAELHKRTPFCEAPKRQSLATERSPIQMHASAAGHLTAPCFSIDSSLLLPSRRRVLRSPPPIPEESSSFEYFDDSSSELSLAKGMSELKVTQSAMVGCVKRKTTSSKKLLLAERISATASLPLRKAQTKLEAIDDLGSDFESDFERDSVVSGAMSYNTLSSALTTERLKSISSCKKLFPKMQSTEGRNTSESGSLPLADYSDDDETEPLSLVCCKSVTLSGEDTMIRTSTAGSPRTLRQTMSFETGKRQFVE